MKITKKDLTLLVNKLKSEEHNVILLIEENHKLRKQINKLNILLKQRGILK